MDTAPLVNPVGANVKPDVCSPTRDGPVDTVNGNGPFATPFSKAFPVIVLLRWKESVARPLREELLTTTSFGVPSPLS